MNNLDKQYQQLLTDIGALNGTIKTDRTGTGTISVFGRQIRHKMSEGFPLLTTKKMHWKSIVTELLWFLRGDTNIKFLLDYDCHIWDGDAYKNYISKIETYTNNLILPNDLSEFQESMDIVGNQIKSHALSKEEFINKIKTDDKFANKWGDLGPIYGKQWRSWKQTDWNKTDIDVEYIDQIQNLINELKTNPDSRRLMVNAWNVGELNQMVLPPCHYGFQVYTRELSLEERIQWVMKNRDIELDNLIITEEAFSGRTPQRAISLMWNQRSVDTFLGLPFNIASYGLLLEIIAREVDMIPDELIGNLGDVHLYKNHIEQAKELITRTPYKLPKLVINTEFWQTESGECGVGNLNTNLKGFEITDFQIENYQSHPAIKAPLSN